LAGQSNPRVRYPKAGVLAGKAIFLSVVFGDTLSGRYVVLFFMCL